MSNRVVLFAVSALMLVALPDMTFAQVKGNQIGELDMYLESLKRKANNTANDANARARARAIINQYKNMTQKQRDADYWRTTKNILNQQERREREVQRQIASEDGYTIPSPKGGYSVARHEVTRHAGKPLSTGSCAEHGDRIKLLSEHELLKEICVPSRSFSLAL